MQHRQFRIKISAMKKYPELNLPAMRLRAINRGGCDYVWDSLRGTWLVLTPEEWVRRHVINWLTAIEAIPTTSILQEYPIHLNGTSQRADIVVVDRRGEPVMTVECKAPDIPVDSVVLDQALRYNSVVGARYIMITNGLVHYFHATWDGVSYSQCTEIPDIGALI